MDGVASIHLQLARDDSAAFRGRTAVQTLLDAGAAAGSLRGDVRAEDVVASLVGIFLACGQPGQRSQAGRLLDLLMDGIRARRET